MSVNQNNLKTKVRKFFLLGAKHVFARAIKSPRKSFGKGNVEGKGDRPRQKACSGYSICNISLVHFLLSSIFFKRASWENFIGYYRSSIDIYFKECHRRVIAFNFTSFSCDMYQAVPFWNMIKDYPKSASGYNDALGFSFIIFLTCYCVDYKKLGVIHIFSCNVL